MAAHFSLNEDRRTSCGLWRHAGGVALPHPLWLGLCRGTGLLLRSWTRTSLCSSTARPGPCTCCPHRPPVHAPGLSFSVTQNLSCCRYSVSLTPPHFFTHLPQTAIIICFSSVAQSCLTLCNPMDCSTPGFPVLPHLREFALVNVHQVGDAIQPFHPPLLPPPPALSLARVQGLQ